MFEFGLRTCALGAVVALLLGAGIGVGWHYFADSAGGRAMASAAASTVKHDAPNLQPSNPSVQREGPVLDAPRLPGSSDAHQPTRSIALDLSDEEKVALVALLTSTIVHDRNPLSPRARTFKGVLAKLDAKPPAQPYRTPNSHAPPGPKRADVRRE
jgi:hypothetical protein